MTISKSGNYWFLGDDHQQVRETTGFPDNHQQVRGTEESSTLAKYSIHIQDVDFISSAQPSIDWHNPCSRGLRSLAEGSDGLY